MNDAKASRVLICIDDTDELHGVGTGHLAQQLSAEITGRGWGECAPISRHQLYVHPDIPYTSHNSAMCFAAAVQAESLPTVIAFAADYLATRSAAVADPGLCVVNLATLADPEPLIAFGQAAKRSVLTKDAAYALAGRLGVHLSEHGGTGQGVIGALAGAGLRLGGNDGRFKGKHAIGAGEGPVAVRDILAQAAIDEVRTTEGTVLGPEATVVLAGKVKSVLQGGKSVLLVLRRESDGAWVNLPPALYKQY